MYPATTRRSFALRQRVDGWSEQRGAYASPRTPPPSGGRRRGAYGPASDFNPGSSRAPAASPTRAVASGASCWRARDRKRATSRGGGSCPSRSWVARYSASASRSQLAWPASTRSSSSATRSPSAAPTSAGRYSMLGRSGNSSSSVAYGSGSPAAASAKANTVAACGPRARSAGPMASRISAGNTAAASSRTAGRGQRRRAGAIDQGLHG